jgi:hypothetical protein
VFGISRDLEQRLGGGPKQQAINQRFVLQGQGSQEVGQSEDHMKVGDGQQFGGTFLQPALASCRLALRAVPIQARVIGDGSLSATITLLDVSAERGRTASDDGAEHFEMQAG